MSTVRVPTPLRPYTNGEKEVEIQAETVGSALVSLTVEFPDLKQHLFDEQENIRPYVNVFLNEEDVRSLEGGETKLAESDRLTIVPSIAGGSQGENLLEQVDHAALRVNQASIIALTLAAFVLNAVWLVALVGVIMLAGTARSKPGFLPFYRLLRSSGAVKPDVLRDHPEPHRFSQALGGIFLSASTIALLADLAILGWGLTWIVILLAGLNLFGGFCVGCAVYYWLNKVGMSGFFKQTPPPDTFPGRPPRAVNRIHD